ncbi:hypothetical protein TB1_046500 [Malus domestica]
MEKEKKEENRRKRNRSSEYDDTDCEGSKTKRKESISESAAPPVSPPNHCFALFAVSFSALIASHLLSFFKPAKFPNFSFRLQIARVSIDFAAEGVFWFPDRPLPLFLPPARFSIFQIGQWQIAEKQRYENVLLNEKHKFERLEKLRAKKKLRLKLSPIKAEVVSKENPDEGRDVILELRTQNKELEHHISRLEKGDFNLVPSNWGGNVQPWLEVFVAEYPQLEKLRLKMMTL